MRWPKISKRLWAGKSGRAAVDDVLLEEELTLELDDEDEEEDDVLLTELEDDEDVDGTFPFSASRYIESSPSLSAKNAAAKRAICPRVSALS